MNAAPKFQLWPLLDKEINRGIGRAGIVFTASFCILACGVGYYFIRPWSVLREEDLRQLGYLGFVAIPLAAWLLGGLFAIQLFMAYQTVRWAQKKEVFVSGGTWAWIAFGVLLVSGGVFASLFVDPSDYGFVASVAGCVMIFRTTGAIWACRIFGGATSFPR
jgi:hypothetical protein